MNEHDKDCTCGCQDEDEMTLTLTLEDGTEQECAVLAIFPVEEKQYIALFPIPDDVEDEEEIEGEIYLYRFNQLEDDEIELENIESDEEYDAVAKAFDEVMEEEATEEE